MDTKKQGCTVGDYVTLVRGTTYKGLLVGEPGPALLGLGSIEPGGGFREGHYKTYGGDCPTSLMLFPGDLYVSLKGATKDGTMIGSVARVPHTVPSGRLTQDTVKLEFRNPDPEEMSYLYWILRTPDYRAYCAKRATGSAVVALSRQDFLGYPVPPLSSLRKQLVNLFEGIDRKIENLRRQNETLERIAQTLFKHWFVDFEFPNEDGKPYRSSGGEMVRSDLAEIPAGWEVGTLGEIALFKNGKSPPERNEDSKIPIYGSNGIIGNTTIANNQKTVIIGRVGSYCGSLYYFLDQCWVTDNAMTGRLKKHKSHAYLYLFLASSRLNKLSGGSGQPLLNQSILSSIELAVPDDYLIRDFEEITDPLFRKIFFNQKSIRTLIETRDLLLPQLMSGKLRITE
jgi:type I restriction enzyme S subunit